VHKYGVISQLKDLLAENYELKAQLVEARSMIKALQQENRALLSRVGGPSKTVLTADSTFLTNGGDLSAHCDIW
jgi:hypothetical protein